MALASQPLAKMNGMLCEKVLARHDVKQRLPRGWGEQERSEAVTT
jgi:hypothetical protein